MRREAREWTSKLVGQQASHKAILINLSADLYLSQKDWHQALHAARDAQSLFHDVTSLQSSIDVNAHYASAIQNEVSALVQLSDFAGASVAIQRLRTIANRYPSERADSYLRFAVAMHDGFTSPAAEAAETSGDFQDLVMRR